MNRRPYRFTHRAKLITIAYGGAFVVIAAALTAVCGCWMRAMFQAHGLFWMWYALGGMLLLLYILDTAERVEGKDDGETAV